MGSYALLSSSPSLIWLQLGFGLARAVTISIFVWRENGKVCISEDSFDRVKEISYKNEDGMLSTTLDIAEVKELKKMLITSTGPACEHDGDCLGYYEHAGEHNGRAYFKQLHTVPGECWYLYYDGTFNWSVSDDTHGTYTLALPRLTNQATKL